MYAIYHCSSASINLYYINSMILIKYIVSFMEKSAHCEAPRSSTPAGSAASPPRCPPPRGTPSRAP